MANEEKTTDVVRALRCEVKLWSQDETPIDLSIMSRAADEIEQLRSLLSAILVADERGQGQPFAEAMEAAHKHLHGGRR